MEKMDQAFHTWHGNAGGQEHLEHDLALLEELLRGEQAGEVEFLKQDARGLGRGLAHHLGLHGPVEHLAIPLQDLLLHRRVEPLRIEEEAVHVEDDVRDDRPCFRRLRGHRVAGVGGWHCRAM